MLRHPLPPISFISLILLTITSFPAGAATFTVTNLDDSGPGSLRQAILDANAALDADTIAFQPGLTGTITLTSAAIPITDRLTINGPGADVLAISGNNKRGIFDATSNMTGKPLTINQLTLKDGVTGSHYHGGAISSGGSLLTVNHCIFSNNQAQSYFGGAIRAIGGTVTVNASAFLRNSAGEDGGAIDASGATLTITNATIAYNSAGRLGGGINSNGSTTKVVNSTVYGNSSAKGGGISSNDSEIAVINTTISNNTAISGGGIGMYVGGGDAKFTLGNSIVAGNLSPDGKEIYSDSTVAGKFTSLGHNLFGENGADGLVNVTRAATDLVLAGPIDTALGPLANHSGPTETQLPSPNSPAINAGDSTLIPAGVTTDQRGAGFPRIVNDIVDIGAAEVQPSDSLVAGLTSTGQIYYTLVTPTGAGGGLLMGEGPDAARASSTWTYLPGQLARLSVGDFDGDGEGDLAGIAGNGSIWYTTDRGAWTQVPGGLGQISVGDFTGAGQDGLAGLASDGSIWYSTTLTGWTQVPGQLSQLVTGDFNGDGRDDLAGIAANGSIWYSTNLTSWNNVPGALAQLRTGDLNGDGKADLAGIAANGSVWYSTTLNGWTQAPGALAQLQVGDLNGDGQADLAGIASNGTVWYSTTLTGWTQLPGTLSQLVTSDLNGDGNVDLTGIAANGTIWYSTDLSGWVNLPGQLAQLAGR